MRSILTSLLLVFVLQIVSGQTDSVAIQHWQHRGYVKNLQTWSFSDAPNSLFTGAFFHWREQINWTPSSNWAFELGLRGRVFYGEWVRLQPDWADALDQDAGLLDLATVPLDKPAIIGSLLSDRLWGQWAKDKWRIRFGRQRINWGVALLWNPNDLFNAYNFLDFDYEERPGNDALRVQYQVNDFEQIELAYAPGKNSWKESIAAARYRGHIGYYDWQVLTAYYHDQIVLGGAWAGNLGNSGFKGELSYFNPLDSDVKEPAFSGSVGLDGLLGGQWFWTAGFLINTNGSADKLDLEQLGRSNLSPENLMPGKFSTAASISHPITPLINGSLNVVYSPNGNLTIFIPSISWSAASNWDLDLVAQSFWLDGLNTYENGQTGIFLRVRWSY